MISAEEFLAVCQQEDLLPVKILESLRGQVARSAKPIAASAVATLLIQKGLLTPALAQRLLNAAAKPPGRVDKRPKPSAEPPKADDDDLGLLPLDDSPGLPALDERDGLLPLDAPSELEPLQDLASLTELTLREESPKPPAARKPSAAASKPATKEPNAEKGRHGDASPPRPSAAAGSLLDEELPDLSNGMGLGTLDGLMNAEAATLTRSSAGPLAAIGQQRGRAGIKKRTSKGGDWAMILVIGGTLLGLLLLGGVLLWRFSRPDADELLRQADADYLKGAFAPAIQEYDVFLRRYPSHPVASLARVHRGLAELRQTSDGSTDWVRSLEAADRVLKKISSEGEFSKESQADLLRLLPAIAQGLAAAAEKSLDQQTVDRARKSLAMVETFIAPSARPTTRLTDVESSLALTQRKIDRGMQLDQTLTDMNLAVRQGKNAEAYQVYGVLLKQYPDVAAEAKLQAAMRAVSRAEQAAVKRVAKQRAAQTTEPAGRMVAHVALASRTSRTPPPESQGRVIFVRAGEAVWGLDAATGKVLWRRFVGIDASDRTTAFPPTAVDDRPGSDAILVDAAGGAVLRVEAASGKLRWRQAIGERFDAYPVITRSQVLVATRSGRLVSIDLASGNSSAYVQLPQPLRVAPAVDPRGSTIYQVAEHSHLYVLSTDSGLARDVVYLGHAPGSIVTPPVLVSHFLIVAENDGARQSRLRVLNVDGARSWQVQEIRLPGHVLTPLAVADHRVLVVTDVGSLGIFDVSGSDPQQPLVRVGEGGVASDSTPAGGEPGSLVRFPLLLGAQVLVADSQLTRYGLPSSGGRLTPTGIQDERSTTLQPLVATGRTVFHVRHKDGTSGVLVSALAADDKPFWETDLASPLACEPMVDPTSRQITLVTAAGACFQLDAATLKAGIAIDQPAAGPSPGEAGQPISNVVRLDGGLLALCTIAGGRQIAVYGGAGAPLHNLALPDALACRPASFAGGILAPTKAGQILLLDPLSGVNRAEPFQPRLQSGVTLAWQEPAVLGPNEFAVTDGRTNLYRVTIQAQPQPYLSAAATAKTPEPIEAPLAAVGEVLYAADAHTLTAYELPKLSRGKQWPLGGRCVWGPRRVGQRVLLATDDDQLYCLTPREKLLWQVPLTHGPLAGPPAELGGRYVLASLAGTVWTMDAESGKEATVEELGCPLGCGPVPWGEQLLLAGRDGTLYLVGKTHAAVEK